MISILEWPGGKVEIGESPVQAIRRKLLRTAELAGTTISRNGKSHCLLADMALVGEAITLAMRTAVPWK